MLINKKWHPNSSSWVSWLSPVAGGPDTSGDYYELEDPIFSALTGDIVVIDSDFEGDDLASEVLYTISPSSLWEYDFSNIMPGELLEGHTGLWALNFSDNFDFVPSSVNMVDMFWELDESGNLMPRAYDDNIGG